MWIECTQLEDEFLSEIFAAFCVPANCHVVVALIMKIKMARNWFGRIRVVFFVNIVGAREGGPPIFSLFRLCISSYIVGRLCNK